MPCTMGLYYSFIVTHKRAVCYTFSSWPGVDVLFWVCGYCWLVWGYSTVLLLISFPSTSVLPLHMVYSGSQYGGFFFLCNVGIFPPDIIMA